MTALGDLKPISEGRFDDWVECGDEGRKEV